MEPRETSIPRTGARNPPWESRRRRSPLPAPLDPICDDFHRFLAPPVMSRYSGLRVRLAPQAAAELWGGKRR
ncbi:unnamed protein product [Pleuronectes platessa]|uniref:Uncharacterized protein n=1 Tax=Pleuronectes platessa TaxID=8262 RepID=A0A9N7YJU5_PLEPL|nr:unnamed protein product [Pleuronectes platessa]